MSAQLSGAQQELQSVKAELEASQTKNSELTSSLEKSKTELETAQTEKSELSASLEKSRSELSSVRSEYSSFKSEAKRLWTLLDGNLLLNHAILGIYSGDLLNDLDRIHDQCMIATGGLAELKDLKKAELEAFWAEAYIVKDGGWTLYHTPFEKFIDLNASRITIKAKALREQLAK